MIFQRVQRVVRQVLPAPAAELVRATSTALLTPFYFSIRSGHLLSSLRKKAIDPQGNALPWYTYPTIDLLRSKDFSGASVLEFGAGHSTLWWGKHAARVVSFEGNPEWFEYVKKSVPSNVDLRLVDAELHDFDSSALANSVFDVVVVDGLNRLRAAQIGERFVAKGGCLLIDNSDRYSGMSGDYPIMRFLREAAYSRVDFYGHAPGVILPHCTSLFFKGECFVFQGQENPRIIEDD